MKASLAARRRRGTAAVEFALILPVLITLTLGVIDWCWYLLDYQSVLNAAHVAARVGSQTKLVDDPAAAAQAVAESTLLATFPVGVPVGTYTATLLTGNTVNVAITVNYDPLVGLLLTPGQLNATAQMRVADAY